MSALYVCAEEVRGLKGYYFGGRLSRLLSAYVEPKSHILRILAGLAIVISFVHYTCYVITMLLLYFTCIIL